MIKKIAVVLLILGTVLTAAACNKNNSLRNIKLLEYSGNITCIRHDSAVSLSNSMKIENGDIFKTDNGTAYIELDSDKKITVTENTCVSITANGDETDNVTMLALNYGEIINKIDSPLSQNSLYEIITPEATIGVYGTTFLVKSANGKTIVYCDSGVVVITSKIMSEKIVEKQCAVIENDNISIVLAESINSEISDYSNELFFSVETEEDEDITETIAIITEESISEAEETITSDTTPEIKTTTTTVATTTTAATTFTATTTKATTRTQETTTTTTTTEATTTTTLETATIPTYVETTTIISDETTVTVTEVETTISKTEAFVTLESITSDTNASETSETTTTTNYNNSTSAVVTFPYYTAPQITSPVTTPEITTQTVTTTVTTTTASETTTTTSEPTTTASEATTTEAAVTTTSNTYPVFTLPSM